MHLRVHLGAPRLRLGVGKSQVGHAELVGDHEVGLHVTDQVLDQTLGLRVRPFTEIRAGAVVGHEAHVVRGRDHEPGHRGALQTTHAIGEQGLGHTPDRLHAFGQRRHGGLRPEVVGEGDEAEPTPGQHGAEHEERADLAPVEHHDVTGRPHPEPTAPVMVHPPLGLGLGHRSAQVACRAAVAGGPDHRQQPLGRDPPVGACHPLGDDHGHLVVVVGDDHLSTRRRTGPGLGHRPPDRLVRGAADGGRRSIGAHLLVGGIHVHTFPR